MKKKHYGIPAIILASFFFACLSALNRIIPQSVGTFHQVLIRTLMMGGMFLLSGFFMKGLKKIKLKHLPLFLARGVMVAADFSTFFIAVSYLQLGVTLFLFYASNIIANYLYGFFVLHEKITRIKLICFLLAVFGLGTMYINNLHAFASIFVFFALFAGFAYGIEVASSKSLTDNYSVNQVNGVAFLTATLLSIPLLIMSHENSTVTNLSTVPWVPFFIFSFTGVLAFYIIVYGFKYVEAQKASLISLSEILFVICIGFFFYKEIPTIQTLIGGICIIISLALPNIIADN